MSLKRMLLLSAVALGVLLLVTGCFFGVTIDQRLDQFISDLNLLDRGSLYLNLNPSLVDYNALKDPAYWEFWFPDGGTTPVYELSLVLKDDAGDGTATASASIDGPGTFSGPKTIEFGLVRVGFEWMINSINLGGDDVVPYNLPT